jgi:hypothetical protein
MSIFAYPNQVRITPAKVTAAASVGVGGLAFWMSFESLTDLAGLYGVPEHQAFAFPLVVDGLVIVATVGAATLKGRAASAYAWALLILGTTVSVAGNAVHANTVVGNPIAVGISVIPPVFLLVVTHLTILLARQEWAKSGVVSVSTIEGVAETDNELLAAA